MLLLTHLALFFLISVIIYIILRAILYYALYLFLTRIFNAKVKFRSGYSFCSIQDVYIDSDQFQIECKLFMISAGVHTNMQLRKLLIKKGDVHHFKEVYLDAQRIVDRALPSKRFFHISIDVDNITFQTENFSLSMDNIHSIHTDSQHSLSFQNCLFSNPILSIKTSKYAHSIHFSGNLPEKIQIMRPLFNIKCDSNTISSDLLEISAYSETPSIWRAVLSLHDTELTFPHFTFLNDVFTIKFSHQILFSIVDSLVTFESLHIKNYLHQFKIKINHVKLSHDKIKVKKIIGNSNIQFLRILNHLRWLLYASCKIKKTELLIKLENGELLDIVVLNFEERNKLDENENKNSDRRPSEVNLESEGSNFQYLNIFNRYCNSFNKHNIQLSEGEALITNPSEITNGFHSGSFYYHDINDIFNRPKKEFVKADEVKMEMVAHRTLISSIHMSNIQINRQNVSQFSLNTLNVIYSNSETFQLYCQELYDGFSEKVTSKEHNITALVKSLRVNELLLNRTLTSENLNLELKIEKAVPLEESRKSLKSLFPKLADLSKIKSVILLNYNMNCSEMKISNTFSVKPINYSGKMALFHNGTKLLTCGVVHCISDKATIPLEYFVSPAFWYISFELDTLKIKYDTKKAVFRSIKGESAAFTFESATLFQDIVQLKKPKTAQSATKSNMNGEAAANNDDDSLIEDKSISIFDFWTENVIPIGSERKTTNSPSSASSGVLASMNESSNTASFETEVNLMTDTNLNLTSNTSVNLLSVAQKNAKGRNGIHLNRFPSQFDFEDSVFRPSQHQESSINGSSEKLPLQKRKKRKNVKVFMRPTDQIRNSLRISPKLTSEYVPNSLFESSESLANFTSYQSAGSKKTRISSFDNNMIDDSDNDQNCQVSPLVADLKRVDSTKNISIGELKSEVPFYEPVRYKFECFNGEYYTNTKDDTVEFKVEKAVLGDVQYTNVFSKFEKQDPVTFNADQIEWPYMKAFFTEFSLSTRTFKAKSMSLNSNFVLSSFDPTWLNLSHAEIGQILFKSISLDDNTIINQNFNKNDRTSTPNRSPSSDLKNGDLFIESKVISMNAGKFSFRALDAKIPLLSTKSEFSAKSIRISFTTIPSFLSFLRDINTQFKKITSDKIVVKPKLPNASHLNNNNQNNGKVIFYHKFLFLTAELNFILDSVNVFDICSKTVRIIRIDRIMAPKSELKEPTNNQNDINKKEIKKEMKEIFKAMPLDEKKPSSNKDDKQQLHIIFTFKDNEREKICPRLNISLNTKVIVKCDSTDAQMFKEFFESIFLAYPHEKINKFVFDSTSFLKFLLILEYFDSKDPDFDEERKYELNIDPVEIPKQTKTFHDMILYIFDYVMKIVRSKVVAIKRKELQQNGPNYT